MRGSMCPLNTKHWCPVFGETCLGLSRKLHCVLFKGVFFLGRGEQGKSPLAKPPRNACPVSRSFYCPFYDEEACRQYKDKCILWLATK